MIISFHSLIYAKLAKTTFILKGMEWLVFATCYMYCLKIIESFIKKKYIILK